MKLRRHFHERFPIYALVVNAKTAPIRIVLKNLKEQLIDAGAGLTRAGVAGDEPAPAKILACPLKAFELDDKFAFHRLICCCDGKSSDGSKDRRHNPRGRRGQKKE